MPPTPADSLIWGFPDFLENVDFSKFPVYLGSGWVAIECTDFQPSSIRLSTFASIFHDFKNFAIDFRANEWDNECACITDV